MHFFWYSRLVCVLTKVTLGGRFDSNREMSRKDAGGGTLKSWEEAHCVLHGVEGGEGEWVQLIAHT